LCYLLFYLLDREDTYLTPNNEPLNAQPEITSHSKLSNFYNTVHPEKGTKSKWKDEVAAT
jgi:hypothetical protein